MHEIKRLFLPGQNGLQAVKSLGESQPRSLAVLPRLWILAPASSYSHGSALGQCDHADLVPLR